MGQAKQRGTQEQRIQLAKQRIDALRPDHIICNNCKAEITDVHVMDTRGIRGIDGAFAGLCPSCGQTTYALKGEADAMADFAEAMQEAMGSEPQIGAQAIKGNAPRNGR